MRRESQEKRTITQRAGTPPPALEAETLGLIASPPFLPLLEAGEHTCALPRRRHRGANTNWRDGRGKGGGGRGEGTDPFPPPSPLPHPPPPANHTPPQVGRGHKKHPPYLLCKTHRAKRLLCCAGCSRKNGLGAGSPLSCLVVFSRSHSRAFLFSSLLRPPLSVCAWPATDPDAMDVDTQVSDLRAWSRVARQRDARRANAIATPPKKNAPRAVKRRAAAPPALAAWLSLLPTPGTASRQSFHRCTP